MLIKLVFFPTQSDLRKWFQKNYKKEKELLVGFYKVSSDKASIRWSQSVDEALCFGWIDGIRRSVDKESYCIRFTPRKPTSNWSTVNIKKAEELIKLGLMKPGECDYLTCVKRKSMEFTVTKMLLLNWIKNMRENLKQTKKHGSFSNQ